MWTFFRKAIGGRSDNFRARRRLFFEPLEERRVLAGNVLAALDFAGNLSLTGDGLDNDVTITFTADNTVDITGNAGTTIVGPATGVSVTGSIRASLLGGNDDLTVVGGNFDLLGGGINYLGGTGDNDLTVSDLSLASNLLVQNSPNGVPPASPSETIVSNLTATGVSVFNGANTSTVTTISGSTIAGSILISNPSGGSHSILLQNLLGVTSISATNGSATTSNSITLDGVDMNDAAIGGAILRNGNSGGSNFIDVRGAATDIRGSLSAANGFAGTTNFTEIREGAVSGNMTLTNGNATTSAASRLGDIALVTVGGNLLATNGTSGSNSLRLDRALVAAGRSTTLLNGSSTVGENAIIIGAAPVTLGGGLIAMNGTSAANNRIEIEQATIGTAGGAVDNVLLQNGNVGAGMISLVELGDVANVAIADGGLTIFDGAGNGLIDFIRATIAGGLNIQAGAGNNTINLAVLAGATMSVAGTTNVSTQGGMDTLSIGTGGGIAVLDSIFASLGAGNDILNIGAGAAGGSAFASTAGFLFDGGAGSDTANIEAAVNAALFGPPITPPAAARFLNFETINVV
ncbi:MAG TPA: hypothetical protein VFV87_12775 [Pirellulaceae bacterium]|nr:hypothetical protein [Pirellulaceae bacterium]